MRRNRGFHFLWRVCLEAGRRLKGRGILAVSVREVICRHVEPEI